MTDEEQAIEVVETMDNNAVVLPEQPKGFMTPAAPILRHQEFQRLINRCHQEFHWADGFYRAAGYRRRRCRKSGCGGVMLILHFGERPPEGFNVVYDQHFAVCRNCGTVKLH